MSPTVWKKQKTWFWNLPQDKRQWLFHYRPQREIHYRRNMIAGLETASSEVSVSCRQHQYWKHNCPEFVQIAITSLISMKVTQRKHRVMGTLSTTVFSFACSMQILWNWMGTMECLHGWKGRTKYIRRQWASWKGAWLSTNGNRNRRWMWRFIHN